MSYSGTNGMNKTRKYNFLQKTSELTLYDDLIQGRMEDFVKEEA